MHIAENVLQRERVLRSERNQHTFFSSRCLQFKIEVLTEFLAQCQPPRAIDSPAEWRVQDQLHATRLIEKTLQHERVLSRQRAENTQRFGQVNDDLPCCDARYAVRLRHKINRALEVVIEFYFNRPTQLRDCSRKLITT